MVQDVRLGHFLFSQYLEDVQEVRQHLDHKVRCCVSPSAKRRDKPVMVDDILADNTCVGCVNGPAVRKRDFEKVRSVKHSPCHVPDVVEECAAVSSDVPGQGR